MFEFYQEQRDRVEPHTLLDFALSVSSHEQDSVHAQLSQLHDLVVPGAFRFSDGIFKTLATGLQV